LVFSNVIFNEIAMEYLRKFVLLPC